MEAEFGDMKSHVCVWLCLMCAVCRNLFSDQSSIIYSLRFSPEWFIFSLTL